MEHGEYGLVCSVRNVLDMNKVREIRQKYKENPSLSIIGIANEYEVSKSTIWLVINNRIWKEV